MMSNAFPAAVVLFLVLHLPAFAATDELSPKATRVVEQFDAEVAVAEQAFVRAQLAALKKCVNLLQNEVRALTEAAARSGSPEVLAQQQATIAKIEELQERMALLSQSAPQVDAVVAVPGAQWDKLGKGTRAFSNRRYVWKQIPSELATWQFIRLPGGGQEPVVLKTLTSGKIYIAVLEPHLYDGWTKEPLSFGYSDVYGSLVHVLSRTVDRDVVLSLPRTDWAGPIVLSPGAE